jgi:hypothetical protein
MKVRSIALAAAALMAGQAHALSPVEVADASVVKIYMSGATALRNIIGGLFTQNCSADLSVYYSGVGNFGGVAFATAGDAHRVYACTMKSTSPILPGKKVALFKSDLGGSGQGVFPVYFGAISPFPTRTFLALTTATCGTRQSSVPNYTCSTEQNQVPTAGVSDVEPGLFKGVNVPKDDPNYPADGLSESQLAEMDIAPVFQTVFAVAANKALRDAMQAKQGLTVGSDAEADRPSISLAEATSYFAGQLADPANGLGWQPIVSASDPKRSTRVNICRRVDGSGTQSSANAMLVQFPCNANGPAPADYSFSDSGLPNAIGSVGPSGSIFVFEGSTTGNVINCLATAEDTGAYALGHVSKENNEFATGSKWRHLKLDGVAPNRDNTKSGKYNYFFESTIQWHNAKFATLSQDQKDFLVQFRTQAAKPDSLASLSAANQLGVAALPDSYAGAFGTGTANEIAFGSRVQRGGNSCQLPVLVK